MANKNDRELRFKLNDDDYKAFGRYRILFTKIGRRMVNRQRITYAISGVMLALLFSVFKVDAGFARLAYIVAAVIGVGGVIFADKILLRQQNKAIEADANNPDRVHPDENIVNFDDDKMRTKAGADEQEFDYRDIRQVDMTEDAIYVWMSDTMIMPLPLHAFKGRKSMEDMYSWLEEKIERDKAASKAAEDNGRSV